MESIENKLVLITGSTDGIGKQTAVDLLNLNAKVIVHGRTESRVKEAVDDIKRKTNNHDIQIAVADLSSLYEIKKMAEDLKGRFDKIDCLINNAGVLRNHRELSQDGFELTFAVNHLSYFLLTGLILDLIRNSDYARIINVASQAHAHKLDFDNIQGDKHYEGYDAYSRSKLCNILFTYKLSHHLKDTHISANVLHPGVISTKLLHAGWGSGGADVKIGSRTSVYLASSSEVKGKSGLYFSNLQQVHSSAVSYDGSVQDKLWLLSEKLTGYQYDFSWVDH